MAELDNLMEKLHAAEAEKEKACQERNKWNERAEMIAATINAELLPRIAELRKTGGGN
jgi:hypothetical protein